MWGKGGGGNWSTCGCKVVVTIIDSILYGSQGPTATLTASAVLDPQLKTP